MINAIAPWYGSNRMLAKEVGRHLAGCEWVGVGCGGGMCELQHINARTIVVSDLHRHVINLCRVAKDPTSRSALIEMLNLTPFHPDVLEESQKRCQWCEEHTAKDPIIIPSVPWAVDYFIASWMARSGCAGTKTEFNAGLATRWNAGGGDSVVRFRNATQSLEEWSAVMQKCTFECLDVFEFIGKVHDKPKHGIYIDPPFPGPGDKYKHKFTEAQHVMLASRLRLFNDTRVVCRFYDHPMIRDLYRQDYSDSEDDVPGWKYHALSGRDQHNSNKQELLLVLN